MSTNLLLVSHGAYATGLHDALKMFVGTREDIVSIGLQQGEDQVSFSNRIKPVLEKISKAEHVLVLADLIGGSPLTSATNVLQELKALEKTVFLGGMNLAMALNAALLMDQDLMSVKEQILTEAHSAIKEFILCNDESEDI